MEKLWTAPDNKFAQDQLNKPVFVIEGNFVEYTFGYFLPFAVSLGYEVDNESLSEWINETNYGMFLSAFDDTDQSLVTDRIALFFFYEIIDYLSQTICEDEFYLLPKENNIVVMDKVTEELEFQNKLSEVLEDSGK